MSIDGSKFESNSHKSKQQKNEDVPEKNIEKVISGTAKTKKKSGLTKFTDVFVAEDIASVKNYIITDVLVPAVKTAISDIVRNGIDMLLYGEASSPRKSGGMSSKVSYRNYSQYSSRDSRDTRASGKTATSYSYDDVVIDSRGEAEEVLARMDELLGTYGIVSVADFYDLVGITGNYTDNKYGWCNLNNAQVMRVREGYMIKLPKAMPLD